MGSNQQMHMNLESIICWSPPRRLASEQGLYW